MLKEENNTLRTNVDVLNSLSFEHHVSKKSNVFQNSLISTTRKPKRCRKRGKSSKMSSKKAECAKEDR